MKAIIVSGGFIPIDLLTYQIKNKNADADLIICADSGADVLYTAEILPNVLLGDFDSINKEVFDFFVQQGIKTVRFNTNKDVTDTHIAIKYAINQGAKKIIILGAVGDRVDHTLSNIFLLESYMHLAQCKIIDAKNKIELITDGTKKVYSNKHYKYISLIPISKKVVGVTTDGFKYQLTNATLHRNDSFGVSNEMIQTYGSVAIRKGLLAVIQAND